MEAGKLAEHIRERAVKKHLTFRQPEYPAGAGHGRQTGFYTVEQQGIVTAQEAVTGKNSMKIVLTRVLNDLWAAQAKPEGVSLEILLSPRMREITLRRLVQEAKEYLELYEVPLTAVDTQITEAVSEPVIVASAVGDTEKKAPVAWEKKEPEQYSVLCAGWCGALGTSLLGGQERIRERFSERYRRQAEQISSDLTIKAAAAAVKECSEYLLSAAQTGIFGALWDLSEELETGFRIELDQLPLRQETIEFCEVFDKNPYWIASDGAVLIVTKTPGQAMEALVDARVPAAVIGHLKKGKDKLFVSYVDGECEEHFLDSPRGDELQ